MLATIEACNFRNYSIFLRDGYMFSYMEYIGENYDADMQKMAADPMTQLWWKETGPCQLPVLPPVKMNIGVTWKKCSIPINCS